MFDELLKYVLMKKKEKGKVLKKILLTTMCSILSLNSYSNNFYSIINSEFTYVPTDTTPPSQLVALNFLNDIDLNGELTIDEIKANNNIEVEAVLPIDAIVGDKLSITGKPEIRLEQSDIDNGKISLSYDMIDYGETLNISATLKDVSNNVSPSISNSVSTQLYIDKSTMVGESYYRDITYLTNKKIPSNFTMETWVKPQKAIKTGSVKTNVGTDGTTYENYVFYPDHGGNGTGVHGLGLSVGTNGIKVHAHSGGYMPSLFVDYRPISSTEWNHIVVSVKNDLATVYLNGVSLGNALKVTSGTVYSTLSIGDYHMNYGVLEADIAIARIWDNALTSSEVADYYNKYVSVGTKLSQATLLEVKHD